LFVLVTLQQQIGQHVLEGAIGWHEPAHKHKLRGMEALHVRASPWKNDPSGIGRLIGNVFPMATSV
jgi:hypothetical protein